MWVEDGMWGFVEEEREGVFELWKAVGEVVGGEVGDEVALLLVDLGELGGGFDGEVAELIGPEHVQWLKEDVLFPLSSDLGLYLAVVAIHQRFFHVLE